MARPSGRWSIGPDDLTEEGARRRLGTERAGDTLPHDHYVQPIQLVNLGVYPELVRERDRWSKRIGGWPAGVVATLRVLRADRHPLKAELSGKEHPLWLLFAGNGTYRRMGPLPARRYDLADGRLDVRVVHGGRFPAVRLLAAAVAGPLTRSPAHAAVRVGALRVEGVEPGTLLAYDGEVTTVEGEVTLRKLPEALTVYRPLQQRH